jgi:hypothetical protein
MTYALRGIHTKLDVIWNYEAPAGGGDTHVAIFKGRRRGSRSGRAASRTGGRRSMSYPTSRRTRRGFLLRFGRRWLASGRSIRGSPLRRRVTALHVTIPDKYRDGHEAHFAEVARRFFTYLRNPESIPSWEAPNMLAKYYTTTKGLALGYQTK